MRFQKSSILGFLFLAMIIVILPITIFDSLHSQDNRQRASGGFPHVVGTQIIDGNGNPLILRGAQIETAFNVMSAWGKPNNSLYPPKLANPLVFAAMRSWHMNVLRLPIDNWIYNTDKTNYINLLDQVVSQANSAGIYVILDLHDDSRAGSPYPNFRVATSEMIQFWKDIATHYINNPMVMYDVLNEPYEYPDWATWFHGGTITGVPVPVLGFQDLVNAVRSTGSQQIIIIESWQKPSPPSGSFNGLPSTDFIQDPSGNLVYSYHDYTLPNGSPQKWDALWGPILGKYPLYVGEWAFLPNAYHTFMCQNFTATQGTQGVMNFLNYLDQNHINWTAWQFDQYHLIQDETSFTPTVLSSPAEDACCGTGPSVTCNYGMGTLVKNFLSTNSTPTTTPSPTWVSGTPEPTPGNENTEISVTVGLHGIGNGGDNVNSNARGTMNPLHPVRNVTVTLVSLQGDIISARAGNVTFNTSSGLFSGIVTFPNAINGTYLMKIKSDGFLERQIASTINFTQFPTQNKRVVVLPSVYLVNGDLNNDNQLDISDYNILIECYGDRMNSSSCPAQYKPSSNSSGADIDDDGIVDGVDYNLFLRELSVQHGG